LPFGFSTSSTSSSTTVKSTERNVVLFSIPEESKCRRKLSVVLNYTAGREVAVEDAVRIGRANAGKLRPIMVKLSNACDKRLTVISWRLVYLLHAKGVHCCDKPLELIRQKTISRLYRKAEREFKAAEMSWDGTSLVIDGVIIYLLQNGFERSLDPSNTRSGGN